MWSVSHGDRTDTSFGGRIAWTAGLALALPIQASLAPIVAVGGTTPDIPLLVVLLFALCHGSASSVVVGAALGTGLDLLAAGRGPFYVAAYAALALIASSVGRITATVRTVTVIALVAVSSLALGVGHLVWGAPVERADDLVIGLTTRLAPQALYDTVMAWLVFAIWRWRSPPPRDGFKERDELFSAGRFQGLIR